MFVLRFGLSFFELNFAANWIRRFFSNNEQRFDSLEPFVREEVYLSDFWTFWPKKVISISLLRAAMPCQCVCERICQKEKQFSQFHQHCMSNFFTNFILTLKIQRQTVSGEKLGWTLSEPLPNQISFKATKQEFWNFRGQINNNVDCTVYFSYLAQISLLSKNIRVKAIKTL